MGAYDFANAEKLPTAVVQLSWQPTQQRVAAVCCSLQGKKASSSKLLCGGNRVGDKGFYFEPTIFEVYDNSVKIAQEEIFGPVQCVFKWTDLNEVNWIRQRMGTS